MLSDPREAKEKLDMHARLERAFRLLRSSSRNSATAIGDPAINWTDHELNVRPLDRRCSIRAMSLRLYLEFLIIRNDIGYHSYKLSPLTGSYAYDVIAQSMTAYSAR